MDLQMRHTDALRWISFFHVLLCCCHRDDADFLQHLHVIHTLMYADFLIHPGWNSLPQIKYVYSFRPE